MAVSAFNAGIRCRCPNCGEGHVFRGMLSFKERCEACGADLTIADAGDGPAFFVGFAALIFIVPAAMLFEFGVRPPGWVHILIWPPITIAFAIFFLRPVKSLMFALQWKHRAGEARLHDGAQE
jgi:uncharacterized protein (DUF983 family)